MRADFRDQLVQFCQDCIVDTPDVVVPEPYIPYIPQGWNGVLVLAEAQNLSRTYSGYAADLKSLPRELRVRRLGYWPGLVGIQPWDNGPLRLAVAASLGADPDATAASNAVLWSITGSDGKKNENPREKFKERSIELWGKMLDVIRPEYMITAGAVAREVTKGALCRTSASPKVVSWTLPSPRVLQPLSSMVAADELRRRFPEVDDAIRRRPEWAENPPEAPHVFYACLAVVAVRKHGY
jgi:hypothetical protein